MARPVLKHIEAVVEVGAVGLSWLCLTLCS